MKAHINTGYGATYGIMITLEPESPEDVKDLDALWERDLKLLSEGVSMMASFTRVGSLGNPPVRYVIHCDGPQGNKTQDGKSCPPSWQGDK